MRLPEFLKVATAVLMGTTAGNAQPVITKQPTDKSVSLGANVRLQLTATSSAPPLDYQWWFADSAIAGQTNAALSLTNITVAASGNYYAVVMDSKGASTSKMARLEVDPTFGKITTGSIVTDGGYSFGCSWGDYDDDGFVDLIVCNMPNDAASRHHFLYHNNGNGTFLRVTTGPIVNEGLWATSAAWGDYDNDGKLDLLLVGATDGSAQGVNRLYHNDGGGVFSRANAGSLVTQKLYSHAGIWADFNRDGFLDALVVNFRIAGTAAPAASNYLYTNRGDGTFAALSLGTKTAANGDSWNAAAADFDNDGWLDLFVPQGGTQTAENGLLYLNDRSGGLVLLTNSLPYLNKGFGVACTWGDYDNDGFPDLFVSHFYGQSNSLYHNNGNGSFTLVTNSVLSLDGGTSVGCAWGDYDNDGWLDLFVANLGTVNPSSLQATVAENNFLYHNNGDGTFTKVRSGSLVNDQGYSTGCAWADYDDDGFLDLFVSNGWAQASENNFLYRNSGNTNHWIRLKLVGSVSNRAAIGAKVRVTAMIKGKTVSQLREISGGSNYGSQNDMRLLFGLADATNVETITVEWPSGSVQELRDQAVTGNAMLSGQTLIIYEPPKLRAGIVDGRPTIEIKGGRGFEYAVAYSDNLNLGSWVGLGSVGVTNANGTAVIIDTNGLSLNPENNRIVGQRFYRAYQSKP